MSVEYDSAIEIREAIRALTDQVEALTSIIESLGDDRPDLRQRMALAIVSGVFQRMTIDSARNLAREVLDREALTNSIWDLASDLAAGVPQPANSPPAPPVAEEGA